MLDGLIRGSLRHRSLVLLATLWLALVASASVRAEDYVPTVLVTGANRGIGLEYARQFAAKGYRVIGTARDPAEARELAAVARELAARVGDS